MIGSAEIKSFDAKSGSMVRTPASVGQFAWVLLAIVLFFILALIYVPWQQSVTGIGQLTAFSPANRPQSLEAQIPARIVRWHVQEGQRVVPGQLLAELAEIDQKFLDPALLARMQGQKAALESRLKAAQTRSQALQGQISALTSSRAAAIPGAEQKALQATNRLEAARQAVVAAEQNAVTAGLNLRRVEELFNKGLRSRRDLELSQLDQVRAKTEVERANQALTVSSRDVSVAQFDQAKVTADTAASLQSAQASLASTYETIAGLQSDLLKIEVDLRNVQQRVAQRTVRSPIAGRVVRLLQAGPGQTVDSGEILATVVPHQVDQAVELYISENDAPLVTPGRPVRLQFAGWPAIQFIGWPSIAVGTFGGVVSVIDATDSGMNRYRVLIRPDTEAIRKGRDEPWPSPEHLRAGAQVTGWIMLDTVPLGYELWRQFNAFPPTVDREKLDGPPAKSGGKDIGAPSEKDDKPKKKRK